MCKILHIVEVISGYIISDHDQNRIELLSNPFNHFMKQNYFSPFLQELQFKIGIERNRATWNHCFSDILLNKASQIFSKEGQTAAVASIPTDYQRNQGFRYRKF